MVKVLIDYYAFLKVDRNADTETIKKAYEELMKNYDSNKKYSDKKERLYQIRKDAYIILTDEKKRAKYDTLYDKAIRNKRVKNKRKKIDIKEAIDVAADINDKYDILSKLVKVGAKTVKGGPMISGAKLAVGGAVAGYGVKKGREYMGKRARKENNDVSSEEN